jgi:NAD(P)-dependent dehydrogenase (short-subunit alcohol dehydrogenase family)
VSLKGKVALVTGAGRGIGQAVALQLADAGVRTALVARSEEQLSRTAGLIREREGEAIVVPTELGDPARISGLLEHVTSELGPIAILINNAASVEPLGASAAMDPADWAATFGINVFTPAALSFAVLPQMLAANWGRIVNVSSGIVARPAMMVGGNAYVATKAALEAHTVNLAAELAASGVTVNVYRPGSVDTAMQALIRTEGRGRLDDSTHDRFLQNHAQGTLITPDTSARSLVQRLAGDDSGQIWDVADSA